MQNESKKIKIAQMTDTYYPTVNGIVTVVDGLTTALNKSEEAFVCTTRTFTKKHRQTAKGDYNLHACRGFYVPIQKDGWSCISLDRKFRKSVVEENPDVLHCHTVFRQFAFAKKISKKKNIPLIVSAHTQSHYDFKKFFKLDCIVKYSMKRLMKTYNSADEIWAVNEGVKNYLIEWGAIPEKIKIFPNACDIEVVDNVENRIASINARYNLEGKKNVFLYVGRLMEYKNTFLIVDSLKVLHDRGVDFTMMFVGDGKDKKALIKKVKKYGLEDKVIFTHLIKERDDIIDYYLRADLFLFPSIYDTDGLVKSEAAICGTPSVMIEGSIATIGLNDREDVYLAKEDAVGFADKICEIIKDKENFEFVKKNAKVKLYRTWEQNASVAVKMYKQAIENKKNNE